MTEDQVTKAKALFDKRNLLRKAIEEGIVGEVTSKRYWGAKLGVDDEPGCPEMVRMLAACEVASEPMMVTMAKVLLDDVDRQLLALGVIVAGRDVGGEAAVVGECDGGFRMDGVCRWKLGAFSDKKCPRLREACSKWKS